jgi:hypothetical protein
MPEPKIDNFIDKVLTGETQKNALEFASYLRANEMLFVRGKGYWEDKLYWMIKYKDEYVCFILINGSGSEEKFAPWTIWSDDSDSNWFEYFPLDEPMKEIAWRNVDACGNCGGCDNPGGSRKTIFGKEFNNVCRTTMRFINPDTEALECVEIMVEIRKNDILRNEKRGIK